MKMDNNAVRFVNHISFQPYNLNKCYLNLSPAQAYGLRNFGRADIKETLQLSLMHMMLSPLLILRLQQILI